MLRTLMTMTACCLCVSAYAGSFDAATKDAQMTKQSVSAYEAASDGAAAQQATSSIAALNRYKKDHQQGAMRQSVQTQQAARAYINGQGRQQASSQKAAQMESLGTMAGGIADLSRAQQAAKIRHAMGLNKRDQLYIFVSHSMPDNMIRSYALAAAYAGAALVMRGIPKDETLQQWLHGKLIKKIRPDGNGAMIEIDPRLFDAFAVKSVPTIVYTNSPLKGICDLGTSTSCPPLAPSKYSTISGSVTLTYALEQFVRHGAKGAARFQQNLAQGYALGKPHDPTQMAGLNATNYSEKLVAAIKRNQAALSASNDIPRVKGTDVPVTTMKNTPFGPQRMPVNAQLFLKNTGTVTHLKEGE